MTADGQYVYKMKLTGGVTDYDATTRAATTKTWKEGDVLYLRFPGETTTLGIATFDGFQWELKTDASIVGSGNCTAVSIDGGTMVSDNSIGISPFNAIYEGKDCAWSFSNDVLMVHANLNPLVGRLRLRGAEETVVSVTGLSTYTSFDRSTGQFTTSKSAVKTSIQSDGYTPYMYGMVSNSSYPLLGVNGYVMECPITMLKEGQSGWLDCPTASNHAGWTFAAGDHEYVDLGLSVKWATCNVGASSPEDYGEYYAWGETETKEYYGWDTYKWMESGSSDWSPNKYQCEDGRMDRIWYQFGIFVGDNKTVLDPEDDVAHVKWGASWRMPTYEEQTELREQCIWTWVTQNGTEGFKITSKITGKFIFLPATGYRYGVYLSNTQNHGRYWSSSLDLSESCMAYEIYFSKGSVFSEASRYIGSCIRPVCL